MRNRGGEAVVPRGVLDGHSSRDGWAYGLRGVLSGNVLLKRMEYGCL